MSRRRKRTTPAPDGTTHSAAPRLAASRHDTPRKPPLSRRRYAVFLSITMLVPLVLLALAEGLLRIVRPDGGIPVFVDAPVGNGAYRMANPRLATRYFASERSPPVPQPELLTTEKPPRAFRIFVLGESTTAGFPYPRNGTFTRLLRDVLRDVLPDDSVEVINLGIAATNSYAVADIAAAVVDERPDAVLVYAGHNEYYGALGVGSSERVGAASPLLVRSYLALQKLRVFLVLRDALGRARLALAGKGTAVSEAPTFMEVLARDQEIALGDEMYRRGVDQLERNLTRALARFRDAGVPVFIGSLASNVRDQSPFVAAANAAPGGASAAFASARSTLAGGDSARARLEFARARDLDVVRFRAPSDFNGVVRRVADASGATYVPVEEAFASAAIGGAPGYDLFLEHVHPNRRGYALLARAYFEAIERADFLGRKRRSGGAIDWDAYMRGMELTPFDERIAEHTTRTVVTRWPFVSTEQQLDYRGTYRPTGVVDSLALLVSRGGLRWEHGKLQVAAAYEKRGVIDSALAEYRGLVRDAPLAELPLRLQGRALLAAGRAAEAESSLRRALAIAPTAYSAHALGMLAMQRREFREGIKMLELASRLEPNQAPTLFQLSLAYGLTRDLVRARAAARQVRRIDPRFPGLAGWMQILEMTP